MSVTIFISICTIPVVVSSLVVTIPVIPSCVDVKRTVSQSISPIPNIRWDKLRVPLLCRRSGFGEANTLGMPNAAAVEALGFVERTFRPRVVKLTTGHALNAALLI